MANEPLDDTDALSQAELIGLDSETAPERAPDPTEGGTKPNPESEKTLEELLDGAQKPAEEKPEEEKPAENAAKPAEKVEKPAEEQKTTEKQVEKSLPGVEDLNKLELGPHARPETRDQFAKAKEVARKSIEEADRKRSETEKKVAELEEKLKSVSDLPPEAKTELEELRTFRRAFDIERDPQFKAEFDKRIEANGASIIMKLADLGVAAEKIEKIKQLGIQNVDWAPILEKLPPVARQFVTSKLVDNETAMQDRRSRVEAAKGDAAKWEESQKAAKTKTRDEFDKKVIQHLSEAVKSIPWAHLKEPGVGATPEQVAECEAHNKFIQEASQELAQIVADESPRARAESALSVPVARYYKAENERLQKQIAELTKKGEELDRVKAARQTTKQARSAPATSGKSEPAGATLPGGTTREEHLDRLWEEASRK